MPVCSKCHEEKPPDAFVWRDRANGLRSYWCRTCHGKVAKVWRDKNKEKTSETAAKRYVEIKKDPARLKRRVELHEKWAASKRDAEDSERIRNLIDHAFNEDDGSIYFAYTNDGRWKIGYTSGDVATYLHEVSTFCSYDIELKGSCFGTIAAERALHRLLAKHRIHPRREWFYDCSAIRYLIKHFCSQSEQVSLVG